MSPSAWPVGVSVGVSVGVFGGASFCLWIDVEGLSPLEEVFGHDVYISVGS